MSEQQTIKVPDIGDFSDVEIIEVLVAAGDTIGEEDSIITVESDKASMEIPSPTAGTVSSVLVKVGDRVSEGSEIIVVERAAESDAGAADRPTDTGSTGHKAAEDGTAAGDDTSGRDRAGSAGREAAGGKERGAPAGDAEPGAKPAAVGGEADEHYELVVIGAGPGGYTAAFRAADLGLNVLLIERYSALGGVCLNVGCIPSKALLHTTAVIREVATMDEHGVSYGAPTIDIDRLRGFKDKVIDKLTGGLAGLARQRKVTVATGRARFTSPHSLSIEAETPRRVAFEHAIIAAGSQSIRIPDLPYDDARLMDSTGALELHDIPPRLLVIGGGIIGLEMGCVYAGLGSRVTVVELTDGLMPGCDRDLVKPLEKRLKAEFENIFTGAKVTGVDATEKGLTVHFEGGSAPESDTFDRVLLAVGRVPNGKQLGADQAGVEVDERGFIAVDSQQRTNVPHIFAIGDIVGQPMLAHKATHEGKVAAEAVSGMKSHFDAKTIPSVAYTDPEVAWMGLTETDAKRQGIAYEKAAFPWAASGRSLSMGRSEGLTKVLYDPDNERLLGAGMVGPNAGELIAEAVLALEMGADVEDIALTVHPHPTLSETFNFASEVAEGTITDIYVPKKRTTKRSEK